MNIILIFTYGISLKNWQESGLLDRELLIYNKLIDKYKINYTFITFGDKSDLNLVNNKKIKIIPIYSYIKKSNNKYFNILKTFLIPFYIRKELKNTSLIKTNQLNGSWVGIIFKYLLKVPLIIRTGYNLYEFTLNEKKPLLLKFFHKYITYLSLNLSDIYIVTSKSDKDFLEKSFKFKKEILIIPNWVQEVQTLKYSKRFPNKIISVGRMEKQKNFKNLVDVLSNSLYKIDIYGEGSEISNLKKIANQNISFKGKLKHSELIKQYKYYKVFITTSLFEGNPKSVLEAMASGCVVLAKDNKNIREIVKHKVNGYLFNSDTELLKILDEIMYDELIFEKVSKNAIETIQNNNNLNNILKIEIELYNLLIK